MFKSQQVEDLLTHGLHYITAITKPQIESLLAQETITMSLFDQALAEVQTDEAYDMSYGAIRCGAEMQTECWSNGMDSLPTLRG